MAGDASEDRAAVTAVDTGSRKKLTGTVFEAGELVANRYVVQRFIAEGGMGEVYAARDIELAEELALKTIRGEYAARPMLLAKFKREIHVARQVTHPNVCRVYDLGQHQGTSFLTMQLLPGESLAQVITRQKRLSTEDALPIARQIAAGVDAAHRAGVVHRDLKPGNVMLLPVEGGPPRAVITDFGLARRDNDDPQHDLTRTGEVAGSPAYMAPEQVVEDGVVGPPADIYAFGIILFEMVTGVRPFDGHSTLSTASKRLVELPPSPCKHVPDLDPRWERAILRCLEREQQFRPKSATEAVALLQMPVPKSRKKWIALAAAGAIVAGAAAGVVVVRVLQDPPAKAIAGAEASARRAVAVIGFKNLAAKTEMAWISTALSELFTIELGGELRALAGQDIARARSELGIAELGVLDAPTLGKLRTHLGADVVVTGSYFAPGGRDDKVRLDIHVQDAAKGVTLATISEQGNAAELPDVVVRASMKVRDALGMTRVVQGGRLAGSLPRDREAARLYAEGIEHLNRLENVAARDAFEQAARIEPEQPIIRAALAEAWAELGYDNRAREQAKLALAHVEQLPPSERALVEARYHLAAKEWDAAIAAFSTVAKAAPDDLHAGLQLARAQVAAQRPKDALATLAAMRGDPRIELEAARAHSMLTALPAQRDAAARAVEQAEAIGAKLLASRARVELASAAMQLGEHAKAREQLDQAEQTFKKMNDVHGLASVMHVRANFAYREGKNEQADAHAMKAASFFREVGAVQRLSRALVNLGVYASQRGDTKLAIERYKEAIEVARSADDRLMLAYTLAGLADIERLGGSLADAKTHEAEALEHARATHSRRVEGFIVQTLGQIALAQAELAEADARAKESMTLADALGDPQLIALTSVELGRVRFEANDLLSAREHLQRAHAAHEKTSEHHHAAVAETELAALELADNQPAEAIAHAAHARDALADTPNDLARALATLVRAQLAAGKLEDARATAAKAAEVAKRAHPDGRIRIALAIAELDARDGKSARAREGIAAARKEADELGQTLLAMYCELAASKLDRDATRLAKLGETANARGLLRLAALAR